ncbi:hypothetical protein KGMB01110_05180 [Mediterraneibacter butyricigenes]|uniref:DUF2304 domain-containing protein n=1 Tax=Mediterraneibacter butyricigenes TaxID=2316025 RepID=A0A391PHQ1_9FIRM|nr:DUF2304 domain-containing protein [Mediterraneibacter butyricigenes]GCA66082.1 hypothetical protein KGMB01110_05180 [Mediterraneibacter butyricigenes]
MNIKIQIVVAVIIIFALSWIINMVKQRKLELRYALAWLGVGVGIFILNCFPMLITRLAHLVGVASPTNMLFFCGFLFALTIIFILTVAVSRMSIRIKNLAQQVAFLEKKVRDREDAGEE